MRLTSLPRPLLTAALAASLFTAEALGAPSTQPTRPLACPSATARAQELPLRFKGDGMTITVTALDEAQGKLSGTLELPGGSPMPFKLDLTVKANGRQQGRGRVQDGTASLRIRTTENEDGSIKVTYRAKRYVISLEGDGDVPPPVPGASPPPSPGANPQATTGTIRLRKHTFNDAKFQGGQPSHTMLVPAGWKVEGGAFWGPDALFKMMPSEQITLTSPEGVMLKIDPTFMAVDKTPPAKFGMPRLPEGSADDGLPVFHVPQDLAGWKSKILKTLLPAAYPKARDIRVLEVAIIPELTAPFRRQMEPVRRMNEQNAAMEAQMGGRTTFECFVLGAESRYKIDGVEYEEMLLMAMTVLTIDNPMMGREVHWTVAKCLTMRAPVGKLAGSVGLLSTLSSSLAATEPWLRARSLRLANVLRISANVAANRQRETAKRSAIMSKAFSDIRQSSDDSHRRRSAANHQLHGSVVRSINDSEIYMDQGMNFGVQLPGGYDHVYSNGVGEYILTNDAFVNPVTDLGPGNWTPLNKKE